MPALLRPWLLFAGQAGYLLAVNRLRSIPLALVSLALITGACDKGDAKKDATAKKADDAQKGDDAKKADAADSKEDAEKAEPAKPEAKHFDVSADKSGVLARSAAALEANKDVAALGNESLAEMSHHAEKLPSANDVCKHIKEVRHEGDEAACVKEMEHHIVLLGPELYALAADCLMSAQTSEEIDVCVEAEKEAELLLHEKPHGEGLAQEQCDAFFVHFEKLAMDDAGPDHAEVVKEILEEVKGDIVTSCVDQGNKAEVECAMKATTLADAKGCSPLL